MLPLRSHCFVAAFVGLLAGASLKAAEDPSSVAPQDPVADTDHARKLMEQGNYAEAKKEWLAIVNADLQLHGPQDPKSLSDRLELAIAEGKADYSIKAEAEIRSLLAIFVRRRGADHEETLKCRIALAGLLDDLGRSHEAVTEYRQILDSRVRLLGVDDLEVARVRHLLGDALAISRECLDAIEQYRQAGVIFAAELGAENPETLFNRANQALSEAEIGKSDVAEKELKEVLAIRERLFGPGDVSVSRTCYQLGRILGGQKRYDEALPYATHAVEGLRSAFPPSNPVVLQAEALCTEIRADIARTKGGGTPTEKP